MSKRLAIVISHPIQYYSPLFQRLSKKCNLKVFYTLGKSDNHYDVDFQKEIKWDIPLLESYEYSFLENQAKKPGYNHFLGIVNSNLISEIQAFNPNVILFFGWSYYSHLKAIRHFKNKIPIWFRGDSNLIDDQHLLKKTLRKILLRWVYNAVDKAFYVGKANKAYFKENGLKENQLAFAPHSIDNERFKTDHYAAAFALRTKFGLGNNDILILFAGKFEAKKNPTLLMKAFLEIDNPTIHLAFVGNGKLEYELKADSKNSRSSNRIHFLDFQNQTTMPSIYQACDLFCLPSQGPSETWGLAVNEAMAAGKAVLVSNKVGSYQDLVKEGYNGYVFQSQSLNSLKEKLILLSNLPKLRNFGQNSSEIIASWSFEDQAEKLIKHLYESI
ncbi:glycosyltransferase involved in cell wall biosynthesis [Pedobacter sp. W3I1]|uniref:glycosyltransferase family 4 protein n=1 Tax=Pedobacter sp. W3I1 TaxID=3042291 RepID=UPI002789C5A3|nr:glycosyltransferase family 4 protein [Pedobacter sp. W3I1]MDQ0640917.1 glycosyltransferase involved in cell wall biosynthesis [Pedobacter sp. W3I1]